MKRIILMMALAMFLFAVPAMAKHDHLEKEYQAHWCSEAGGVVEYRLDDGTRVDCLLNRYAVEVDFGPKWAESIGQSLYYGYKTERLPGVLLILEKNTDEKYLDRLNAIAEREGIKVWVVTPEDYWPELKDGE
jgi:hypothetical protein